MLNHNLGCLYSVLKCLFWTPTVLQMLFPTPVSTNAHPERWQMTVHVFESLHTWETWRKLWNADFSLSWPWLLWMVGNDLAKATFTPLSLSFSYTFSSENIDIKNWQRRTTHHLTYWKHINKNDQQMKFIRGKRWMQVASICVQNSIMENNNNNKNTHKNDVTIQTSESIWVLF